MVVIMAATSAQRAIAPGPTVDRAVVHRFGLVVTGILGLYRLPA
jgi:hypothetical protein